MGGCADVRATPIVLGAIVGIGSFVLWNSPIKDGSSFASTHAQCQSLLGQVGEALSASTQQTCNANATATTVFYGALGLGALLIVIGLVARGRA
jgi:hypothetical protein